MSINIRKTALELLISYENENRYVNLLLSSHSLDKLSPEERSSVTALLYTAVEKKLLYDYLICAFSKRGIADIDPYVKCVLRIGLCQILDMDSVPDFAAVNETVKLSRHDGERKFINAVLRRAVNEKNCLPLPPKEKNYLRYMSIYYSVPLPLVRRLASIFGEEGCEEYLRAVSKPAPLSLTVNVAKTNREALIKKLASFGAEEDRYTDFGITLGASVPVKNIDGFSSGEFFVQDGAARLAVLALGAKKGETIIDVCAAPGGKSFGAAIAVGEGGKVYSFDLHASKLSLISSGALRLGLKNIEVCELDATEPREELFGKADRVICDVPCSGLGVLSKKPDLKYKELSVIDELPALQYSILESSAKYLKAGGVILYSTCTVTPEENACVTDKFISEHPEFAYDSFEVPKMGFIGSTLTLLPHLHGTDGFYIAKLRKVR